MQRNREVLMENKENTKNIKPKKINKNAHAYKMCFIIVTLTLIFALIAVFAIGKTVALGSSEALKIEFYTYLNDNGLSWLSHLFFGDEAPSYGSVLPPALSSDGGKVEVLFSGGETSVRKMTFTEESDGFDGVMLAISDPTSLSIGSSTQKSNVISGIMNVEHASLAFSFADAGGDRVLFSDGKRTEQGVSGSCGYFGFTSEGVMHFGNTEADKADGLSLAYATVQEVHSLIVGGVPCDFETTRGELGVPSFSAAQCADGSVLLLFLDANASCREITELLYRYSAINAAILYTGECVGFIDGDGTFSFGESFDSAEYACAWILK